MVYHSVVLNVQKNTNNCALDIIEKDKNSHQLLIKLVCSDGHYFNVTGYTPEIEFYDSYTKTTVLTTAIDIVNNYRGYLSYILGERILSNPSRYTVTLRLYESLGDHETARLSCTFILNVLKDPAQSGCTCPDIEVTISKQFYDELKNHLDNSKIHVSDSDRAILSFLTENLDNLVTHTEFDPVKQNVSNLNEITDNLTKNVSTLDTNVTNVISTVEALARQIEDYDSKFNAITEQAEELQKIYETVVEDVNNLKSNDTQQDKDIKAMNIKINDISSQLTTIQQDNLNWVSLN